MASFWGSSAGFLDDNEEGDDTEQEDTFYLGGRDGLIFLIDSTDGMFEKVADEEETPFDICIKCAKNVLMNKIISNEQDLISVILYGTAKSKNPSDFKGIYILQDLDMPDASRILELESLVDGNIMEDIGKSYDFSFADSLWACSNLFANSTFKIGYKRVMIFTNNDDPHQHSAEMKRRAIRKAKDLADLGIVVDLMHMRPKEGGFNVTTFFQDIVCFGEDEINTFADPLDKFEELLTRVRFKQTKKRSTGRIALNLGSDMKLSVSLFTVCRASTKSSFVNVYSKTNEEVKTVTKQICNDTGQELIPTDIKYYQEFGGSKVVFEKEEIDSMKNLKDQGLHLLGFKPRSALKMYYHVKTSQFIYPDEKTIRGSTTLFSALLKRCLAKDVMPLCVFVPRRNAAPRLAALLPQEEELDDNKMQIRPPGFHVISLPFSDDIRKLHFDKMPKATDEQIDKAKTFMDKLKFKFSSDLFENPSLQKFYRNLEALALDREDVEEVRDLTVPDANKIEAKAGKELEAFKSLVFPADYNPEGKIGGKRKATGNAAAESKKVKTEDVDLQKLAQNKQLLKLTVPVLKQFCQSNHLKPSSQKKADLIDAIYQHFGS